MRKMIAKKYIPPYTQSMTFKVFFCLFKMRSKHLECLFYLKLVFSGSIIQIRKAVFCPAIETVLI